MTHDPVKMPKQEMTDVESLGQSDQPVEDESQTAFNQRRIAMFENEFDEAMEEVSVANGVNWNDDSKIRLFARFLNSETDPHLFQRFEDFLERQAQEEAAQ